MSRDDWENVYFLSNLTSVHAFAGAPLGLIGNIGTLYVTCEEVHESIRDAS